MQGLRPLTQMASFTRMRHRDLLKQDFNQLGENLWRSRWLLAGLFTTFGVTRAINQSGESGRKLTTYTPSEWLTSYKTLPGQFLHGLTPHSDSSIVNAGLCSFIIIPYLNRRLGPVKTIATYLASNYAIANIDSYLVTHDRFGKHLNEEDRKFMLAGSELDRSRANIAPMSTTDLLKWIELREKLTPLRRSAIFQWPPLEFQARLPSEHPLS